MFGLANCYEQVGDHAGAVATYLVTPTSHLVRTEAVVKAAELLAINGLGQDSAEQLASVKPDPVIAAKLHVLAHLGALEALAAGAAPPQLPAGTEATPISLRRGLEAAYRQLAQLTLDPIDKLWLVDCANQARPWTVA